VLPAVGIEYVITYVHDAAAPDLDHGDPFEVDPRTVVGGLVCDPSFPPYALVRQTRSAATLCDQMRPDGSNIAPPTSVYNPVHG